jgi:hypothetical protein
MSRSNSQLEDQPEGGAFALSKWYFDSVAEDGRAAILYAGALRWKLFSFSAQSSLKVSSANHSISQFSIGSFAEPQIEESTLHWQSAELGISGSWLALEPAIHAPIFETNEGVVHWSCIAPRARTELRFRDGERIDGYGYAERLEMTIRPWRLPLRELRWGRFTSANDSFVWIDWRGVESNQFVFLNGYGAKSAQFSQERIELKSPDALLELREHRVLKSGSLAESLGPFGSGLASYLPGRLFQIQEDKWLSRGRLIRKGKNDSLGWVIHEVVQWP